MFDWEKHKISRPEDTKQTQKKTPKNTKFTHYYIIAELLLHTLPNF